MTPAQKAKELIQRFHIAGESRFTEQGRLMEHMKVCACAMICVEEIMKDAEEKHNAVDMDYDRTNHYIFWNEVKAEIKKL